MSLSSTSQTHIGHLIPHVGVLVLGNPRICVEAVWRLVLVVALPEEVLF